MTPYDVPPAEDLPVVGSVVEFDDPRGLGTVESGDGRRFGFHCTAITDGTRTIDVGRLVVFTVAPGRLGRLEAANVRPLPGVPAPGSTVDAAAQVDMDNIPPPPPDPVAVPSIEPMTDTPPRGTPEVEDAVGPSPAFWTTSRPSPGPPPTWMTPVYREPSPEEPSEG